MASSSSQPEEGDTGKVEVTILASEWGSSKGGLSTVNRELAIQLAKFPFVKVTFFLPKCSHESKEEAQHHGISIVEAERQPGYEELDWLSFPPEDLQIDVVVGHGVKLGRQAPIIRKYHKCKWVQVVHTDPEELGMFKSNDNPISKAEQKHHVEVELCQMADLVVAIGSKLTEAFRNYLGSCKNDVFEFTPGIFPDFATVKPVPAKQKHRSVLVSGCGDAEDFELKGFDIAARSVAALPDSHLVFGGAPEGKHEEITERFLGLGIAANRLRVEGYLDWDALKELFCEVDLMLMPSRTEGFCVTGLEALSAGLPVIVSKNAWFGEALGSIPFGSSFVIDSEDPSVWTAAIKGIWNKDRQVRLDESKILRDCYGKKYSWSEQCKNLLEKVVNLIENKAVTNKEIKKKKEKQHIKEMEKRSSEEEMDMTEAIYTDKPVQEQLQGHVVHQSPTGGTMRKPSVDVVRAPAPGISQFQQQMLEPWARSAFTAAGTPNVTPNLSGQSSNSSTPPLTSLQQAEANVQARLAAQVAATLKDSEEKPKKIENAIQKSNANNRTDADSSKAKEPVIAQKQEALRGPIKKNDVFTNATEKASETNLKEATVTAKSQSKEDESSNSGENVLGPKSLVSSVDATNLANEKITDVRGETFTAQEVPERESTKINAPVVGDIIKMEEKVKPNVSEKPVATDALPVSESKTLNGPTTTVSHEQAVEETEKVTTISSEVEVETAPDAAAAAGVAPEPSKAPEDDDVTTQNEETTQGSEEPEVLPPSSQVEEASGMEKVNGHDGGRKASQTASKIDSLVPVATKEMKKKKQKHRFKEIEKRSSEKEMDMMEAYIDKPVQEQVPDQAEEEPVEDTTQTQQEETTEDAPSDDETWEDKEDSWSPDLEDSSDARPDGAKLTYGREFLLQFQTNPLSMMKPEGLPDIDVVLVQARPPSKSGSQQNRMPKGDGGENMFLPSYMRQISKGNPSGSRSGRNRNVLTKKVIELPSMQQQPDLKRVDNRWVRPSEVTKGGNEEEAKTQELFRKVRGILNKLTPQKFQTLTQQIVDLDIDTQERLEGAIDLIFAKAIDEATFSVAYAKMCQFLVSENKKVVVEKDGVKKEISFRKILLNRCQKEFEKENSLEKTINEKLEDLVNQGLNEEELQKRKSDLEDQVHQAKRRTLGNIRFIGELFKLKMLTESIMHDCVVKLLRSNDEESFECLCKLLVTIGKDLDHEKGKPRVDQYFAQINKIISAKITSSRVRFMMQDIVDLRDNNWVPRREDNNPKTIDQIHKEAADQAKKTQIKIQMAKQEKKLQRGNMGGRDSPRPGSIPQADESWTTVGRGPRNMSVDPKKFQNLKRQVDSENISLGPGGRGYGSWARGSSGGTGAVGAGAGPSAAATAGSSVAGSVAEPDNRPANRFSALSSDRKHSAPSRGSFGDSRRQEPRSPVSGGGRRGPFPQGEREKALQAVRAAMQPKRTSQEREGGRESPRTTGEASPAAGSSGDVSVDGSVNSSAVPEVTEETMKKKTLSIIDEFLNIKDMKEVAECLKEIKSPSRHPVFVEVTFNHTMEKRTSERQLTGKLFHCLLRDGVLTSQEYLDGLKSVFEVAEDTEIDIPQLWKYLGELMGPSAFDGNIGLDVLFKCVFEHVQKHKAARLFACMLQSCEKSQEDVRAFLKAHNINLNIFFDDAEEAREFAKDKNIEYALGPASPSSNQNSAKVEEELRNIILKRKARNEEVMDWIDQNVSPSSRKAPFIRALVTVVCEGALDEDGDVCKCNIHKLKDRKNLLQKYIDANTDLEVQALYAVQALFLRLGHPPGFVKSYFDSLYDEEIITEISFINWESSMEEEPGKGVTVMAASEFFRWLRSATEENDEES